MGPDFRETTTPEPCPLNERAIYLVVRDAAAEMALTCTMFERFRIAQILRLTVRSSCSPALGRERSQVCRGTDSIRTDHGTIETPAPNFPSLPDVCLRLFKRLSSVDAELVRRRCPCRRSEPCVSGLA